MVQIKFYDNLFVLNNFALSYLLFVSNLTVEKHEKRLDHPYIRKWK